MDAMPLPDLPPLTTILAATDLSEASRPAVEAACRLARRLEAELHVVSVVPHPTQVHYDQFAEALLGRLRDETSARMKALVGSLPEEKPARLRTAVREGDPREEILRELQETDAELLVVGTHGRTGVQYLSMGSVAEGLVRAAGSDVLLVRGPEPPHFQRLLVALNGTDSSQRAAARALQIGKAFSAERVDSVAAFELPMGWELIGGERETHVERMKAVTVTRTQAAREALGRAWPEGENRVLEGAPRTVILKAAKELESEVVFAGAHNRPGWASLFLGDTARVLAHSLPCSVWFVRDPEERHPVLKAILAQLTGG